MPQISIIKKSDVEKACRFDAEFFKLEVMNLLKNKNLDFLNLGNEIKSFKTGNNLEQTNLEDENSNVYFLRTQQIRQIYINEGNLTKVKNPNGCLRLKVGDLLFTRVGEGVGNSSVITKEYEDHTISDNVISVKLKTLNPFFVSVFLNTKYGQLFLNRVKKGTARGLISKDNFFGVYIPKFEHLYGLCEENIKKYYKKQTKSKQLYKEAEELLLRELDLLDYKSEHILSFETTKKETDEAGRFDAEYFQPKYKEIIKKIENYKNGWDYVINRFKQNKIFSKKDKEFYNYIQISDLNISNGEITPSKMEISKIPANGKRKLFKNDLLISKVRPYRGAISFIDFEVDNLLGSGAFTVLQEKTEYKKETLMIFLKTTFIKELLLRHNCGTSYPVIKDEDILNLKIPLIKPKIQKQIAGKVVESHKLRKQSKELLEKAKKMVEKEIEEKTKE